MTGIQFEYTCIFKGNGWRNVRLTPEMLKALRSEYVVCWENGPRFARSHSASLSFARLQTKARKWMLAYDTEHHFSLIHMEQVKCQCGSHCHFGIFFTLSSPRASPRKQPHRAVCCASPTCLVDDVAGSISQVVQHGGCNFFSSGQRHFRRCLGNPAHAAKSQKKHSYAVPGYHFVLCCNEIWLVDEMLLTRHGSLCSLCLRSLS